MVNQPANLFHLDNMNDNTLYWNLQLAAFLPSNCIWAEISEISDILTEYLFRKTKQFLTIKFKKLITSLNIQNLFLASESFVICFKTMLNWINLL